MDNQLVDDVVDNDDNNNTTTKNDTTTTINNNTSTIVQAQHTQQQYQQQQSLSNDSTNNTKNNQCEIHIVVLSKKDRGRFKKLWKKSIHYDSIINSKSEISGLTTVKDYIEFQSLLLLKNQQSSSSSKLAISNYNYSNTVTNTSANNNNTNSVQVPIIRFQWRYGKEHNIIIDGKDHRDILLQLMYYTTINIININSTTNNVVLLKEETRNNNKNNNLKRKHNEISSKTISPPTSSSCDDENLKDTNVVTTSSSNDCTTTTTTTTTTNLQLPKWINNTIPSWISIHNPVVINHIAVIEIHMNYTFNCNYFNSKCKQQQQDDHNLIVDTSIQNVNNQFRQLFDNIQQPIHTSERDKNNNNNNTCPNTNVLVTETKWYDGLIPKSISDVLMYSTASTASTSTTSSSTVDASNSNNNILIDNKKLMQDNTSIKVKTNDENNDNDDSKKNNNNNEHWTVSRLYEKLYPIISLYDQLKKDGFPLLHHHDQQLELQLPLAATTTSVSSGGTGIVMEDTFGTSTIPSLVCAVEYIQQYQVQQNESTVTESNNASKVDQRPKFVSPVRTKKVSNDNNQQQQLQKQPLKVSDDDKYKYNIFALDCEMVKTEYASELARVTLVQLEFATVVVQSIDTKTKNDQVPKCTTTTNGTNKIKLQTKLIFDVLVKPYNAIIDYVTEYSGVTANMLNGIDVVRIEQVQAVLLNTIHPNDIVIGHSLENDFLALRYIHNTIVDTSHIFQHSSNKFKYSLRHLSAILLKKHIRQGGGGGGQQEGGHVSHCSKEDAITALELAIYRAIIGPTFTINNRYNSSGQINRFGQLISNKETKAVCVGPINWLQQHFIKHNGSSSHNSNNNSNNTNEPCSTVGLASIHALQCETIKDPNTKAIKAYLNCTNPNKRNAQVIWSNFKTTVDTKEGQMSSSDIKAYQQFFSTLLVFNNGKEQKLKDDNNNNNTTTTNNKNYNNQQQSKVNGLLPTNTIIVVAVQHDYDTVVELNKQRQIRRTNRLVTIPWTDIDENNYKTIIQRNQTGLTFWIGPQV